MNCRHRMWQHTTHGYLGYMDELLVYIGIYWYIYNKEERTIDIMRGNKPQDAVFK